MVTHPLCSAHISGGRVKEVSSSREITQDQIVRRCRINADLVIIVPEKPDFGNGVVVLHRGSQNHRIAVDHGSELDHWPLITAVVEVVIGAEVADIADVVVVPVPLQGVPVVGTIVPGRVALGQRGDSIAVRVIDPGRVPVIIVVGGVVGIPSLAFNLTHVR